MAKNKVLSMKRDATLNIRLPKEVKLSMSRQLAQVRKRNSLIITIADFAIAKITDQKI